MEAGKVNKQSVYTGIVRGGRSIALLHWITENK